MSSCTAGNSRFFGQTGLFSTAAAALCSEYLLWPYLTQVGKTSHWAPEDSELSSNWYVNSEPLADRVAFGRAMIPLKIPLVGQIVCVVRYLMHFRLLFSLTRSSSGPLAFERRRWGHAEANLWHRRTCLTCFRNSLVHRSCVFAQLPSQLFEPCCRLWSF